MCIAIYQCLIYRYDLELNPNEICTIPRMQKKEPVCTVPNIRQNGGIIWDVKSFL